jgi:hypothetical protein
MPLQLNDLEEEYFATPGGGDESSINQPVPIPKLDAGNGTCNSSTTS